MRTAYIGMARHEDLRNHPRAKPANHQHPNMGWVWVDVMRPNLDSWFPLLIGPIPCDQLRDARQSVVDLHRSQGYGVCVVMLNGDDDPTAPENCQDDDDSYLYPEPIDEYLEGADTEMLCH